MFWKDYIPYNSDYKVSKTYYYTSKYNYQLYFSLFLPLTITIPYNYNFPYFPPFDINDKGVKKEVCQNLVAASKLGKEITEVGLQLH